MKWTDEQLEEYTRDAVYVRHDTNRKFCYSDDCGCYIRMGIGNVMRERTQRVKVEWSDDGLEFRMEDEFGNAFSISANEDKSSMVISVLEGMMNTHLVVVTPSDDFATGESMRRVGQTIMDMMDEFGLMSMVKAIKEKVDEREEAARQAARAKKQLRR